MDLLRSVATVVASLLLLSLNVCLSKDVVRTGVDDPYRVKLHVVYRAICPACQWFIGNPLLELVRLEGYRAIINMTLIPASGMKEKREGEITCEAGPFECLGHRWQVCVLDTNRDDIVKYVGTIACMEGDESGEAGDWPTKMKNCVTDEKRVQIDECFNNRSTALLLKMVREERSGSSRWAPYTLVNQNVLGSATEGVSLKMLKTSICSAYTGPNSFYPADCKELVGGQKVIASNATVVYKTDQALVATEIPSQGVLTPVTKEDNSVVETPVLGVGGDGIVVDMKEEEGVLSAPAHVSATGDAAGKVVMEMYWRAFCPGCMSFITRPLLSLVQDKEFQKIIDFRPVPAAGTSYDANGKFVCASGVLECRGHKWLSCAVEEFHQIGELVEHIACMESKDNNGMTWNSVIDRCFKDEARTKMQACYNLESDELLRKNVAKRQSLRVPWVPYILLNGVPLGSATQGIGLKELTDAVCKAYVGPENLPAVCLPKRLRNEAEVKMPAEDDAVKPCAPKQKDSSGIGEQHEDAPGIGKPLPSEREAKTFMDFKAKVTGGGQTEDGTPSVTMTAVILPGLCFVGLVVIVRRLSRNHKKDA